MSINWLAQYGYFISIPIVMYLGRYFMSDEDWKGYDIVWIIFISPLFVPAITTAILISPAIALAYLIVRLANYRAKATN